MTRYCDIGVNLGSDRFAADRDAIVARAHAAGVMRLLITGTSVVASEAAQTLAHHYPGCAFTAGIHPHDAGGAGPDFISCLQRLLGDPLALAVGECGLDFDRDFSPRDVQEAVFEAQLALAVETGKPVFLHERAASDRQLAILSHWRGQLRGVIHCFTGDAAALRAYLDLGLSIGITGWICDERRGTPLQSLVRDIPDDRLLVETDAPWLLPRDLRPKPRDGRNEPAFLPHIVRMIAAYRDQDPMHVAQLAWDNSMRLFDWSGCSGL